MLYSIGKAIAILILWFFGRLRVIGKENVPKNGGVLLCANHVSYIDPPALGCASPRPVHFMAKVELFKIPILGLLIKKVGAFPVRQHSADRQAIKTAIEYLQSGKVVGMFPEGTRVMTGKLGEALPGCGMVALRAKVPVIPVALINTEKLLPPHKVFLRFTRVKVVFGEPVPLDDLYENPGRESVDEVGRRVMKAISDLMLQHKENKS